MDNRPQPITKPAPEPRRIDRVERGDRGDRDEHKVRREAGRGVQDGYTPGPVIRNDDERPKPRRVQPTGPQGDQGNRGADMNNGGGGEHRERARERRGRRDHACGRQRG